MKQQLWADFLAVLWETAKVFGSMAVMLVLGNLFQHAYDRRRGQISRPPVIEIAVAVTYLVCLAGYLFLRTPSPALKSAMDRRTQLENSGAGEPYSAGRRRGDVVFATRVGLNVRRDPNPGAPILKTLPKGHEVVVRQFRRHAGEWVFVETLNRDLEGFVNSRHLVTVRRRDQGTVSLAGLRRMLRATVYGLWSIGGLVSTVLSLGVNFFARLVRRREGGGWFAEQMSIAAFVLSATPVRIMGTTGSVFPGWWAGEFIVGFAVDVGFSLLLALAVRLFVSLDCRWTGATEQ